MAEIKKHCTSEAEKRDKLKDMIDILNLMETDLSEMKKDIIEIAKADGCTDCAFQEVNEWEMPCAKCKRGCKDYWRRKAD